MIGATDGISVGLAGVGLGVVGEDDGTGVMIVGLLGDDGVVFVGGLTDGTVVGIDVTAMVGTPGGSTVGPSDGLSVFSGSDVRSPSGPSGK